VARGITAWATSGFVLHLVYLFFNNSYQTNYLKIYWIDRRQIIKVGRTTAVDDQPEISFPIPQVDRQLMFFSKLQRTDNTVLRTLMSVPMVKYEILGLAAKYGLSDVRGVCY